jgi:hypothetical protein
MGGIGGMKWIEMRVNHPQNRLRSAGYEETKAKRAAAQKEPPRVSTPSAH